MADHIETPTVELPLRIVLDWLLDKDTPADPADLDTMNEVIADKCAALGHPTVEYTYRSLQGAHLIAGEARAFLDGAA